MIAFLGMYDMPATHDANARFWAAIRASLGCGPEGLTHWGDVWDIWQSPDLVLAQTCGLPYRARLHGKVTLVGTPDYGLPGCPPGHYNSVLVVRDDAPGTQLQDFAGGTFAYNEALSQSGWAGPMLHLGAAGVAFARYLRTGAHAQSARAVAEGRADMAGLDALTWLLLQAHDPVAGSLRVIDSTPPVPGLPYITALHRDPAPIAAAVGTAISQLSGSDRATLHLAGLIDIAPDVYLALPTPPPPPAQ